MNENTVVVPRYKLLDVARVKGAPYNPARRVEAARLKALVTSMSSVGLLYPILVDDKYMVIDGHRRLAAAKLLGWRTITAIVVEPGADRNALYASVNVTAQKMTGNESLGVWLAEPAAVSPRQDKLFTEMRESLGMALVKKLYDRGLSSRAYVTACRIVRYCDGKVAVGAVVEWLITTAVIGQAMKAMEAGAPAVQFIKAIREGKPLLLMSGAERPTDGKEAAS